MRTRSSIATLLLLLTFCAAASAQTADEELARLRQHLGVPEGTQITTAANAVIPNVSPLKVFVAVGLDTTVRDNYVRWFKDWNGKQGKKYGQIDLVDEMSKADIILARYVLRDHISTRTEPGKWYEITREAHVSPAYNYMLLPAGNGFTIVWRDTGAGYTTDNKRSGEAMAKQLMKMLRARGSRKN